MTTAGLLARQFDIAWRLAEFHVETLTTEECLWRPAAKGLHVRQGSDGAWRGEWPETEAYDAGPPSIAWLTWHIGYWWSSVLDPGVQREQVLWPGSADGVRDGLGQLRQRWQFLLGTLTDATLRSSELTRWPFKDRPYGDVVAWVNVELTKNAAEIGYARFLYATRR
jgi:hypothetical protein